MARGAKKKVEEKDASEEGEDQQETSKSKKGKRSASNAKKNADEADSAGEENQEGEIEEKIEVKAKPAKKRGGADPKVKDPKAVKKKDPKRKDPKSAAPAPATKRRAKSKKDEAASQKPGSQGSFRAQSDSSDTDDDESGTSRKQAKGGRKKAAAKTEIVAAGARGRAIPAETARKLVLDYMQKQNRPYSSIQLEGNLHNQVRRKDLEVILDELVEEGEIQLKEFGKSKIYLLNQKNIKEVSPQEMAELQVEFEDLKAADLEYNEDFKQVNRELALWNAQLTDEQLEQELLDYEQKKEIKRRRRLCKDVFNQILENSDSRPQDFRDEVGIDFWE